MRISISEYESGAILTHLESSGDIRRHRGQQHGRRLGRLQVLVGVLDELQQVLQHSGRVEVVQERSADVGLRRLQLVQQVLLLVVELLRVRQRRVTQNGLDVVEERHKLALHHQRLLHGVVTVVHRRVVLVHQEHEAHLARRVLLERGSDGDEVLQRLAHLEALDVQMAGVQPVVGPLVAAEEAFRLRDLVVVVRELQVDAAGVHIELAAREAAGRVSGHDAALNVPARTTLAPRGIPIWVTLLALCVPPQQQKQDRQNEWE